MRSGFLSKICSLRVERSDLLAQRWLTSHLPRSCNYQRTSARRSPSKNKAVDSDCKCTTLGILVERNRPRLVALYVETANPDTSSICHIGIVHFEDGKPVERWSSLVDPQDYFDGMNVSIHGIDEEDLRALIFKQISAEIDRRVAGQVGRHPHSTMGRARFSGRISHVIMLPVEGGCRISVRMRRG